MERYDGKTRKDDYIKYAFITMGVLLVVAGLCILSHFLKKANQKEPDLTVVIGSEEAFNNAMLQQLESVLESLAEDRNGDGVVTVQVEALRLTDYGAAKQAEREAMEEYQLAQQMGSGATLRENFSGLNAEDDFNRLFLYLNTGDCYLYLLSDQPRGDFRGAATVYCEGEYFAELPKEMQDATYSSRTELTNAPFLEELGLEDIPFYGCVLEQASAGEQEYAIALLRKLQTARATFW